MIETVDVGIEEIGTKIETGTGGDEGEGIGSLLTVKSAHQSKMEKLRMQKGTHRRKFKPIQSRVLLILHIFQQSCRLKSQVR